MPSVFLVGFMGCGKSSVAHSLAHLIGCRCVDLDSEIEQAEGRSVNEIFRQSGEAAFRQAEADQLQRWLKHDNAVVATGGGLFVDPSNRSRIRESGGRSVFLNVPWPVIEYRLAKEAGASRPLYLSPEQARSLYEQRFDSYLEADVMISPAGDEDPETIAEQVYKEIVGAPCGT